jgi:predicted O-methyltransferase YrrM
MCTLETGAGYSTVAFALACAEHICVTPMQAEADNTRKYLDQTGIDATIEFICEPWAAVLARYALLP